MKQPPKKRSAAALAGASGAGAEKSNEQGNPNAADSQRQRIAEHLLQHGSLDTETARMELDIYHPPARIREMRLRYGWAIDTIMVARETASCGRLHRIGKYLLVKAPAAAEARHG